MVHANALHRKRTHIWWYFTAAVLKPVGTSEVQDCSFSRQEISLEPRLLVSNEKRAWYPLLVYLHNLLEILVNCELSCYVCITMM